MIISTFYVFRIIIIIYLFNAYSVFFLRCITVYSLPIIYRDIIILLLICMFYVKPFRNRSTLIIVQQYMLTQKSKDCWLDKDILIYSIIFRERETPILRSTFRRVMVIMTAWFNSGYVHKIVYYSNKFLTFRVIYVASIRKLFFIHFFKYMEITQAEIHR